MRLLMRLGVLAFTLSLSGVFLQALVVQLPGAEDIGEEVDKIMGLSFGKETTLIGRLAHSAKTVEEVVSEVESAVTDFMRSQKNPMLKVNAQMNQSKLIKAILRDCPGAKAELRRLGVR